MLPIGPRVRVVVPVQHGKDPTGTTWYYLHAAESVGVMSNDVFSILPVLTLTKLQSFFFH